MALRPPFKIAEESFADLQRLHKYLKKFKGEPPITISIKDIDTNYFLLQHWEELLLKYVATAPVKRRALIGTVTERIEQFDWLSWFVRDSDFHMQMLYGSTDEYPLEGRAVRRICSRIGYLRNAIDLDSTYRTFRKLNAAQQREYLEKNLDQEATSELITPTAFRDTQENLTPSQLFRKPQSNDNKALGGKTGVPLNATTIEFTKSALCGALRDRRMDADLSIAKVALHIKMDPGYLGRVEKGRINITLDVLEKISDAIDELIEERDQADHPQSNMA